MSARAADTKGKDPYPHSLPVFSVNTPAEAEYFEVFCVQMYDGRKRWTPGIGGWEPGNAETLGSVTDFMREQWEKMQERKAADTKD